jgi:hypothetical protein
MECNRCATVEGNSNFRLAEKLVAVIQREFAVALNAKSYVHREIDSAHDAVTKLFVD